MNKTEYNLMLAGYLSAIADIKGQIRQYSSSSFILKKEGDDLVTSLNMLYNQHNATFNVIKEYTLGGGMKELESCLSTLLLTTENIKGYDVKERNDYLVFRIMDYIDEIIDYDKNTIIDKVEISFEDSKTVSTLFGIPFDDKFLILKFSAG